MGIEFQGKNLLSISSTNAADTPLTDKNFNPVSNLNDKNDSNSN